MVAAPSSSLTSAHPSASELRIRQAVEADLPRLTQIYDGARTFMRTHGNPTQWDDDYPSADLLKEDMVQHALYCLVADEPDGAGGQGEVIHAVFGILDGVDPTYLELYDGSWRADAPYGTIHRIASDGTHSGVFDVAVDFARTTRTYLRIDTHRDNLPMQRAIARCGFDYCGVIIIDDGTPRIAFDWIA